MGQDERGVVMPAILSGLAMMRRRVRQRPLSGGELEFARQRAERSIALRVRVSMSRSGLLRAQLDRI